MWHLPPAVFLLLQTTSRQIDSYIQGLVVVSAELMGYFMGFWYEYGSRNGNLNWDSLAWHIYIRIERMVDCGTSRATYAIRQHERKWWISSIQGSGTYLARMKAPLVSRIAEEFCGG